MKRISLLAVDGCLASSIANMLDTFVIVNMWYRYLSRDTADLFATSIVSSAGKPVICSNSIRVLPHHSFDHSFVSDYLIIPAFLPPPESLQMLDSGIPGYVRQQYDKGTVCASLCTGSFLLAETGLLNGRIATTNWQYEKKFRSRFPAVDLQIDRVLTVQDNLVCSGAVSALMHLVLWIIRQEGSSELASACAKALLVNPNSVSQAPYTIYSFADTYRDEKVVEAVTLMRDHMTDGVSIDQLARTVCLSPRHFSRRFKDATGESPHIYLQKLRIERAKELLENTMTPVEEISCQVGYEDGSAFRRLFKRHTRLSPKEYRDRFYFLGR